MNILIVVCLCFVSTIVGGVLAYLIIASAIMTQTTGKKKRLKKRANKKCNLGMMDWILIIIGIFLLIFTGYMIVLFREYGMIPDTLVTCVFASLAGECGIMGWIKTTKERNKERKWEKEDRQEWLSSNNADEDNLD